MLFCSKPKWWRKRYNGFYYCWFSIYLFLRSTAIHTYTLSDNQNIKRSQEFTKPFIKFILEQTSRRKIKLNNHILLFVVKKQIERLIMYILYSVDTFPVPLWTNKKPTENCWFLVLLMRLNFGMCNEMQMNLLLLLLWYYHRYKLHINQRSQHWLVFQIQYSNRYLFISLYFSV